jgi:hypothetical protein
MAVEAKRGCGYRKVGGLYLISLGGGRHCGKMPVRATVCPTCNQGIKPHRGFGWIDPVPLFGELECDRSANCAACPMGDRADQLGPVGIIWIGEKHYTPDSFLSEAARMGISRRIAAVPKGLKLGETWVLIAHRKVRFGPDDVGPGLFYLMLPTRLEKIGTETQAQDAEAMAKLAERGITPVVVPDDDPDHNPAAGRDDDFDQPELIEAAE